METVSNSFVLAACELCNSNPCYCYREAKRERLEGKEPEPKEAPEWVSCSCGDKMTPDGEPYPPPIGLIDLLTKIKGALTRWAGK